MRLGCINHALLTAEAIARDGLKLAGWVANSPGGRMECHEENLDTLRRLLPAPLLGEVGHMASFDPHVAAKSLSLQELTGK
jgi:dethiobiotin synthetase